MLVKIPLGPALKPESPLNVLSGNSHPWFQIAAVIDPWDPPADRQGDPSTRKPIVMRRQSVGDPGDPIPLFVQVWRIPFAVALAPGFGQRQRCTLPIPRMAEIGGVVAPMGNELPSLRKAHHEIDA